MTWDLVALRDVGTWYGGGTPSKSNPAFWVDGSIPWLSPKDMGSDVVVSTRDHITSAAVTGSSVREVPAGSVAVVVRSGILERTVPIALVPFGTTLNQDMKAVVPRNGIDPRWIAWGLRAHERELLRDTRKAGTTVASIEMPRFYDFKIPIPPIRQQRYILEILEDHLSRLDAAERSLVVARKRIEALGQAYLSNARVNASTTNVHRISEIAETNLGKMLDAKKQVGVATLYLRNINVRWGAFDMSDLQSTALTDADRRRLELRDGDVLVCEGGEPGRNAVWRGNDSGIAYQKALHRIRVQDPTTVFPEYLSLMLTEAIRSGRCDSMFTGTTIKHLPQEKLRDIEIPVPDADVQQHIVAGFEDFTAASSRLTAGVDQGFRRLSQLRRSLLDAAFSGRLTCSDHRRDSETGEETR